MSHVVTRVTLLMLLLFPNIAESQSKGHLIIVGGGRRGPEIMQRFIQLAGGPSARITIFLMATSAANEVGPELEQEMRSLGASTAVALNMKREEADADSLLRIVETSTGVWFSGGDQTRHTAALKHTKMERLLHSLYRNGAVIGGTSAGAAVMSSMMITGDERRPTRDSSFNTIEAENIVTAEGLGFVDEAIVDQHFVRRRRHNRLISLVLEHPSQLGIGIDEGTAIWVKPDRTFEVIGENSVLVFDPTRGATMRERDSYGLRGEDLRFHLLRHGSIFDMNKKRVIRLGAE